MRRRYLELIAIILIFIAGVCNAGFTRVADQDDSLPESQLESLPEEFPNESSDEMQPGELEHDEPQDLSEPSDIPGPYEEDPVPEQELYIAKAEETPNIAPYSDILDQTSIVVYTFAELKSALTGNNGITNIYLGGDIRLTEGITVSSSKAEFVIDGTNPLEPRAGTVYHHGKFNSRHIGYDLCRKRQHKKSHAPKHGYRRQKLLWDRMRVPFL